jgi:hypothetical protein
MDREEYHLAESKVKSLGILPIESSLKVYNLKDWVRFRQRRVSDDKGLMSTFHPRTLTAYILKDNPIYMLNLFHEYFGHGSFCEHSNIGKKIVDYDKELGELEKEIFGEEITEARVIRKGHRLFNQYSSLRSESQDYMMQRYEVYEGFAYWFEMHLSDDEDSKTFKRQIIQDLHRNLIDTLDKIEKVNGINNLIDYVFTLK